MPFVDAVRAGFARYATFRGRARRSDFWWWVLFVFLINALAVTIDRVVGTDEAVGGAGVAEIVASLVLIVPSLAVTVRRLHDTGRSAWVLLLLLVPVLGWILFLVYLVQNSRGDNRYGPSSEAPAAGY